MSKEILTKTNNLISQAAVKDSSASAVSGLSAAGLLKKLILAVPFLFYTYIYIGLRWFDLQFIPIIKNPLGLFLLLAMAASFIWRAWQAKAKGISLIFLGAGLLFLGIIVSLITRQGEVLALKEKETKILSNQKVELQAVKTVNRPNFFFSRDQLAIVKVQGEKFKFGIFPLRRGLTFWHTTQFGFAPQITVSNEQGFIEFNGNLPFGLTPIDPKYNKLIPRRPPPRLMLGVGTYPPDMEGLFTIPYTNQVYFLRLEKGAFQGKNYNLMRPDYYLRLTDGRLTNPVYRLMVWESNQLIANRLLKPGQSVKVKDRQLTVGKLDYWVEISKVKDYGLPLILTAIIIAFSGAGLMVVSLLSSFIYGKIKR